MVYIGRGDDTDGSRAGVGDRATCGGLPLGGNFEKGAKLLTRILLSGGVISLSIIDG